MLAEADALALFRRCSAHVYLAHHGIWHSLPDASGSILDRYVLLPQMMYPVSEIWRPIAFTAPPPHPLLLQPLPSIRLLRSEDVVAAAAGDVPPGTCSAEGGDSSSCPAPSQSRCWSL